MEWFGRFCQKMSKICQKCWKNFVFDTLGQIVQTSSLSCRRPQRFSQKPKYRFLLCPLAASTVRGQVDFSCGSQGLLANIMSPYVPPKEQADPGKSLAGASGFSLCSEAQKTIQFLTHSGMLPRGRRIVLVWSFRAHTSVHACIYLSLEVHFFRHMHWPHILVRL